MKKLQDIEEEVENIQEEVKEVEEESSANETKDLLEKEEEIIKEAQNNLKKEQPKSQIIDNNHIPQSKNRQQASQDALDNTEELFNELKKKGTLRNMKDEEDMKNSEDLSPEEIIKKGIADMKNKEK